MTVIGPNGRQEAIDALLDTGFNGDLVLPRDITERLGLEVAGGQRNHVADGRSVWMDLYRVEVMWDGETRTIDALEAGAGPLIGMSLVSGYRLQVDAVPGGEVMFKRLKALR